MPEWAEIKAFSDLVNEAAQGRRFVAVRKSDVHKCEPVTVPYLQYTIQSRARGKEMMVTIANAVAPEQQMHLLFRMGMSGTWRMVKKGRALHKHAHLMFTSTDGDILCFIDTRRFGVWELVASPDQWGPDRGPDPLWEAEAFRANVLTNLDKKLFDRPICEVLLDQKYFNGIGNYLRAEILHRARVPPFTVARDVLSTDRSRHHPSWPADFCAFTTAVLQEIDTIGFAKYKPKRSYAQFKRWLQVYGTANWAVDGTGRRIWYKGPPGTLFARKAKGSGKASLSRSTSAADDIAEYLEDSGGESDGGFDVELAPSAAASASPAPAPSRPGPSHGTGRSAMTGEPPAKHKSAMQGRKATAAVARSPQAAPAASQPRTRGRGRARAVPSPLAVPAAMDLPPPVTGKRKRTPSTGPVAGAAVLAAPTASAPQPAAGPPERVTGKRRVRGVAGASPAPVVKRPSTRRQAAAPTSELGVLPDEGESSARPRRTRVRV